MGLNTAKRTQTSLTPPSHTSFDEPKIFHPTPDGWDIDVILQLEDGIFYTSSQYIKLLDSHVINTQLGIKHGVWVHTREENNRTYTVVTLSTCTSQDIENLFYFDFDPTQKIPSVEDYLLINKRINSHQKSIAVGHAYARTPVFLAALHYAACLEKQNPQHPEEIRLDVHADALIGVPPVNPQYYCSSIVDFQKIRLSNGESIQLQYAGRLLGFLYIDNTYQEKVLGAEKKPRPRPKKEEIGEQLLMAQKIFEDTLASEGTQEHILRSAAKICWILSNYPPFIVASAAVAETMAHTLLFLKGFSIFSYPEGVFLSMEALAYPHSCELFEEWFVENHVAFISSGSRLPPIQPFLVKEYFEKELNKALLTNRFDIAFALLQHVQKKGDTALKESAFWSIAASYASLYENDWKIKPDNLIDQWEQRIRETASQYEINFEESLKRAGSSQKICQALALLVKPVHRPETTSKVLLFLERYDLSHLKEAFEYEEAHAYMSFLRCKIERSMRIDAAWLGESTVDILEQLCVMLTEKNVDYFKKKSLDLLRSTINMLIPYVRDLKKYAHKNLEQPLLEKAEGVRNILKLSP
jgi:hypothetical protein